MIQQIFLFDFQGGRLHVRLLLRFEARARENDGSKIEANLFILVKIRRADGRSVWVISAMSQRVQDWLSE